MERYNNGKPLRILAVGNSFSQDSVEYLPGILRTAGIGCTVGDLYNPGCTMERHLTSAAAGAGIYSYFKDSDGEWTERPGTGLAFALADEEWDVITIQEASRRSGFAEFYRRDLAPLSELVSSAVPSAKIGWNMTWAYQSDSPNSHFPEYGRDQDRMYSMIRDCVKEFVTADPRISFVIPVGTAVQNARTSLIGDTLTRDGSHLSLILGRYLASLTWASALTGIDAAALSARSAPPEIAGDTLDAAVRAVSDAIASPFAVTRQDGAKLLLDRREPV